MSVLDTDRNRGHLPKDFVKDNVNKFKRMGYEEYSNRRYKRKYFKDLKKFCWGVM